jgi:hypothetical protein
MFILIKYRYFGAFVYNSAEKQMLSAISLFIEQRKNEFDRIAKVWFPSIYCYAMRGWYHFPDTYQDPFLAERVILQVNLLISFKPIICKLNYSHIIIYYIYHLPISHAKINTSINADKQLFETSWKLCFFFIIMSYTMKAVKISTFIYNVVWLYKTSIVV